MSEYWKIPEGCSGDFVAHMEDVLDVYQRDYNEDLPVICMDESPKQLIGEVRSPLPMRPGSVQKIDDEYERKGVAEILLAIEPLTGKITTEVRERRTKQDWAEFIRSLVDEKYPQAQKIVLVMDNLNTHKVGSLYETFPADEARRIAEHLEIHYTPKHGSWLNVAEIGFSLLKRQCIPERVDNIDELRNAVQLYVEERNSEERKISWQFRSKDARVKLKHLYPLL